MNLRDQLKEILPGILPRNPAQSIKGTELIEMVKDKLKQDYSDATLRYHFSIMSCDPSSPIAKVEQGQGYYLRTSTIHSVNSARNLFQPVGAGGGEGSVTGIDNEVALARASKFRAVVRRYLESVQRFPFAFEQSFSADVLANRWRVPDIAVVEWLIGDLVDDRLVLSKDKQEVYRRLGKTPFRVSSVKLRLELNPSTVLEDLYQCLASSEWATAGEILIAGSVDDQEMIDEIRRFSARYGVGVMSFGLDADALDDMPEPAAIENLGLRELEQLQMLFQIRRYAAPTSARDIDWAHVSHAASTNADFAQFEGWISTSLLDERILTEREYLDLKQVREEPISHQFIA
ncbi:MAG: hypothetical protein AAF236_08880 [Verrucomicrobiota bacterium]